MPPITAAIVCHCQHKTPAALPRNDAPAKLVAPGGCGELDSRKRETVIDAILTFPKHVTVLAERGGFAYYCPSV